MKIKFRVWDKKNKEMYQLITWHDPRYLNSVEYSIGQSSGDVRSLRQDENCVIMSYTGIKDKNDKEIYEGDIVATPFHVRPVINRLGCWFVEGEKELGYFSSYDLEVIGNIYEDEGTLIRRLKKKGGLDNENKI